MQRVTSIIRARRDAIRELPCLGVFSDLTIVSRRILYHSGTGDILFPTPRPRTGLNWFLRVKGLKKLSAYLDGDEDMNIEKIIRHSDTGKGAASLIDAVTDRVQEGGIPTVVVASVKGKQALKLGEALKGSAQVVSVTEFGYSDAVKKAMKKLKVVPVENADLPIQDHREMREALEAYGSGVKAALEVAVIAAGKGLASEPVLAVGGSGRGLDTALVVRPSTPEGLLDTDPDAELVVLEVVALPA